MLERKVIEESGEGVTTRWFSVSDGESALVVFVNVVETDRGPRALGSFLAAHLPGGYENCRFIRSGKCNMEMAYLHEHMEVLDDFGKPLEKEQPEMFWREMELIYKHKVQERLHGVDSQGDVVQQQGDAEVPTPDVG